MFRERKTRQRARDAHAGIIQIIGATLCTNISTWRPRTNHRLDDRRATRIEGADDVQARDYAGRFRMRDDARRSVRQLHQFSCMASLQGYHAEFAMVFVVWTLLR